MHTRASASGVNLDCMYEGTMKFKPLAGKFELLRFWVDRDSAPDILYMAQDGGPIEEERMSERPWGQS